MRGCLTRSWSGPETADLRLWRANALKITGRQPEAIIDYQRRTGGTAGLRRGLVQSGQPQDLSLHRRRHRAHARGGSPPDLQEMDRVYLCFALGKALEDRGDYEASWRCYERGNAVRRAPVAGVRRSRKPAPAAEAGVHRRGLRRARGLGRGRTRPDLHPGPAAFGLDLIEQILASHSRVEGTQELTEIGRYVGELCGRDPDCGLPLNPRRCCA
jgi:hypothetical protein